MSNQENSEMIGASSQEIRSNPREGAIIGGSIGFNVGWIIGLFGWLGVGVVSVFIISIIVCILIGAIIGRNSNLRFPDVPVGGIKFLLLALSFTNILIGLIFGLVYLKKPKSGSREFAKLIFVVTGIGFAIFVITLV